MPKLSANSVPSYRRHQQSGQAIVSLNGKDFLLGAHGTAASKAEYRRRIAEWVANDRRIPQLGTNLSIAELIVAYKKHAEAYYRKPDGTPTSSIHNIRDALRLLRLLYGATPAADFGPLKLKANREAMLHPSLSTGGAAALSHRWCRTNINKHIGTIRRMFRWGVENELVPASVYQGLMAVTGLKAGRCDARETEPVKPVPEAYVDAVLPYVSSQVKTLIELALFTGARPGELCSMRTGDIDTSEKVWIYRPREHKTRHHGHIREIRIGPKAQRVLRPFLKPELEAFIFCPSEAEATRRAAAHEARRTPINCGNIPGDRRKRKPKRMPGDRYDVAAVRRAVARACDQAYPPPEHLARKKVKGRKGMRWETDIEWRARLGSKFFAQLWAWQRAHHWHPNQLRHNAGTRLRREYGIDMARIILGHRHLKVTELYAEADVAKANAVMAEVG